MGNNAADKLQLVMMTISVVLLDRARFPNRIMQPKDIGPPYAKQPYDSTTT